MTTETPAPADLLKAVADAVTKIIYVPNFDPFTNPEAYQWSGQVAAAAIAAHGLAAANRDGLAEVIKPWADFNGDLPDYDHPLRCVYESGIQYAVNLLAKELGANDWETCDGTEEFDGDLGGTLMNIVSASLPVDADGERMFPRDVHKALATPQPDPRDAVVEAARDLIAAMSSTYKARNGRVMGIQGDDGEKCYIVHSDQIFALQSALANSEGGV